MAAIGRATQGAKSGQILSRDALLGTRGQVARLLHDALGRLIKAVAVAIRAIHHPGRDNRIAAFANLEVVGSGDDFFGARRTVGEMGVIGGHRKKLSASEDVEKRVDRLIHRFARRLGNRLQDWFHGIHRRLADS